MRSRTTAVIALALCAAGCSGGGSSSSGSVPMPVATATATPKGGSSTQATADFTIVIPHATTTTARRRHYVSPSTQSIGIALVPPSGSAGPPTVVNVDSVACVDGTNGTTCSLAVLAPIGTDTFTVTTYDLANAAGHILSVGSVTGTVLVSQANSFPLTLGGVIAKITLRVANPYLPAGQAGSTAIVVSAFDADRNQIIGTYATPISLGTSGGVTLSAASLASSASASVNATFDGVSRTQVTVTATSGSVTGSAAIVPTTNIIYYPLTGGASNSPFQIVRGPDGAYYFGEIIGFVNNLTGRQTAPGRIGRIDETGKISIVQLPDENPVGLLFVGNDLYIGEQTSLAVGRIKNAGAGGFSASNFSHIIMPKTQPSGNGINGLDEPRILALGGDNNVYVANYSGNDVAYFNPATFGTGAITEIPSNPANSRPAGIALGANGKFYVTTLNQADPSANLLDSFAPGATAMTAMVPTNAPADNVPAEYRFITSASDGNLYFTEADFAGLVPDAGGRITQLNLTTNAYTTVGLPSPYSQPDFIEAGLPGSVLFCDLTQNAIGVLNVSNLGVAEYPIVTSFDASDTFPQDVALDTDGSYWFTATTVAAVSASTSTSIQAQIGHLIFAAGWTLYPALATIEVNGLGAPGAQLLGVAGASLAGLTFTATSSNAAVCTVAQVPGFPTNFVITGVSNGSCNVTVSDGSRSVTKPVSVTGNTVIIQSRRRQLL